MRRRCGSLRAGGAPPIQKITAGGSGAFLHPTHDEDVSRIAETSVAGSRPREYALRAAYPSTRQSRRLTWGNWLFAWKNPSFGIVTAVLWSLTAWLFAFPVVLVVAPVARRAVERLTRAP